MLVEFQPSASAAPLAHSDYHLTVHLPSQHYQRPRRSSQHACRCLCVSFSLLLLLTAAAATMGKSIRSKRQKRLRTLKRQALAPLEQLKVTMTQRVACRSPHCSQGSS
jgi:hypothetical protein